MTHIKLATHLLQVARQWIGLPITCTCTTLNALPQESWVKIYTKIGQAANKPSWGYCSSYVSLHITSAIQDPQK